MIALSGATVGKFAIYQFVQPAIINQRVAIIRVKDKNEINKKYGFYYLSRVIDEIKNKAKGGAQPNISTKDIENTVLDLPTLEIQNKVVATLDKINSLIEKRKKTIELLDEIMRATFLNMFSFKNANFEHWEKVTIESLSKEGKGNMRTGPFGSNLKREEFEEEGDVAVLGIDNAVTNVFRWGQKRFITSKKYDELKNYTVNPRDILITMMGTVGRSAVIPDNIPIAINTKHLAAITLDEEKCNPYFLAYAIHSDPFVVFQIKANSRGAIMDGLNLGIIKNVLIKKPPIYLQRKFEIYSKNISDKKDVLQSSLQNLETLFQSIQQKVFKTGLQGQSELDRYLNDTILQEELVNNINSRDFQIAEEYNNAQRILFDLLESGKSKIKQSYLKTEKEIEKRIFLEIE